MEAFGGPLLSSLPSVAVSSMGSIAEYLAGLALATKPVRHMSLFETHLICC